MSREFPDKKVTRGGKEVREAVTFESASAELIAMGEQLMRENSQRENRKYHTIEHPHTLERRAGKIAEVFGLSERQKVLVRIAIAWHDTIINFTPASPDNIAATITRHRGAREGDDPTGVQGNEALSAQAMELEMRRMNERAGSAIFSDEEIQTAIFMVEATYPGVRFGAVFKDYPYYAKIVEQNPGVGEIIEELEQEGIKNGLLFFQPHLENPLEPRKRIPAEAFVMVLDDLGGAGLATREEFAIEGDKEFQELFANISNPENLRRLAEGNTKKDEADRQEAAGVMIGWLKSQTGFVAWQMLRIEKIIHLLRQNGQIDTAKGVELRLAFTKFESNIRDTLERARSIEREYNAVVGINPKAAFSYLAKAMHYSI
jgi:hypothetical protein